MSGICEGRVVIITGAGRGLGRAYALAFGREGAKVVVNDLGTSLAGEGRDTSVAQAVVDEIRSAGGEAVPNGDDITDWEGAGRLVKTAIDAFGGLDVAGEQRGLRPRPDVREQQPRGMGRGDPCASARTLLPGESRGAILARRAEGGPARRCAHPQHELGRRAAGELLAERLFRGEGRDREPDPGAGGRARALWRDRQRARARGAHAHDRAGLCREDEEARGRIRRAGPGEHRADRRLAREPRTRAA